MRYERTAISKKPEKLIEKDLAALREEDRLTPDLVFRDPYFLDFLGLKDTFSEKNLETAILREMESFILELGAGFSFVARQKRMTIDNEDYYMNFVSVEFAADARRRAYSCSVLPQMPCNAVDAVKSTLPMGRQF